MIRLISAFALLLGTACVGDESVAKYGGAGKIWTLNEIDNAPFDARATMEFGEGGKITGQAPCNRFSTKQTAPYPWFKILPPMSTKMACPDLQSEGTFFMTLSEMSLAEISDDTLVLSNNAGRTMVFKAQ